MKSLIRHLTIVLLTVVFFASCGNKDNSEKNATNMKASGEVYYGGVFRMNETGDVRSLYPLNITEATGFRVANQVYEGLVKYDQKTLEAIPAIAERWESNEDATEWTFYLREGVLFHEDECFDGNDREVTAEDIEWCMKNLCTPSDQNQMFWLIKDRLVGAQEFFDASLKGEKPSSLSGVEVLDDYTIRFYLKFPSSEFPRILGHNAFYVFPQEAFDAYGQELATKAVGTGAFRVKMFKPNEMAVLERNPEYYLKDANGNQLPYLDAVQVSFVKDKKAELLSFKKGDLDMIFTLPIELYSEVMSELSDATEGANINFKPQVMSSLSVHFYSFLHDSEVFSNLKVRKAFNYAIDRRSLINYTLQGEGNPGVYGFVPPSFKGYDTKRVKGFEFKPAEARKLLDEAGYPNGEGFPKITLEISSGGANYELVAQVVEKMLEDNLNIEIEIEVIPMGQQLDNAENGTALFWRDGWVADYPDPENFLCFFVSNDIPDANDGRAYLNSGRYRNASYDSLYLEAVKEIDDEKRTELYLELDQILIDDAVVMPIYYEEFTRLIPVYVRDFPQNSIEYRDLSRVWFDPQFISKDT